MEEFQSSINDCTYDYDVYLHNNHFGHFQIIYQTSFAFLKGIVDNNT